LDHSDIIEIHDADPNLQTGMPAHSYKAIQTTAQHTQSGTLLAGMLLGVMQVIMVIHTAVKLQKRCCCTYAVSKIAVVKPYEALAVILVCHSARRNDRYISVDMLALFFEKSHVLAQNNLPRQMASSHHTVCMLA
jgi:hypothetical protein